MRSRIIWTTVASGVVLIGIGLMHFSLSALAEPGPLETRIANLGKHSVIRLASRHGNPPALFTRCMKSLGVLSQESTSSNGVTQFLRHGCYLQSEIWEMIALASVYC